MENRMKQMSNGLTRRQLLKSAGAAGGLTILPHAASAGKERSNRSQAFRFAHLADIHVQPHLRADEGFRKCLAAVHVLKPRPDFILTGGDLVMDVLAADEGQAKQLFDLYTSICKDSDIPVYQCIGNHDVFGWDSKGKVAPNHVMYGKKMVRERLNLPRTTYSFDYKGWHFCVVDDILPFTGHGWQGGISEEDFDWLSHDLTEAGKRPKVLCAHMPIVSVTVFRG
ncbi:MAG: metallophosphoesterase, partial [Planctomycetota bacterium]